MKTPESLKEGWVNFTRWHCKDNTYIDMWHGDCIDNPNNPTKNQLNLNSGATYFRFNSEKWISQRELGRSDMFYFLSEYGDIASANEIYAEIIRELEKQK